MRNFNGDVTKSVTSDYRNAVKNPADCGSLMTLDRIHPATWIKFLLAWLESRNCSYEISFAV